MNNPRSGSLAKVWTEFKIPDLTKKVPHILNVKVAIDNIITQDVNIDLFSNEKTTFQDLSIYGVIAQIVSSKVWGK